jgi:hypothetical protein
MSAKLYGKYRGTVVNNLDPMGLGRIQAEVPDVFGAAAPSAWAEACAPLAGALSGVYLVPQIGAGVWIEFEGGDRNRPIWSGCRWTSAAEVPAVASVAPAPIPPIVLHAPGATLMLSELSSVGGFFLRTANGAMISLNEDSVVIANGKGASIELIGPLVVVNNGAWAV